MDLQTFEREVITPSHQVPVVVDFWAPWCGPCQFLGPVIEQLAQEAAGRWVLVKVNTDQAPELSQKYRIRGIPALKMFLHGEVVAEFTGALPRPQLQTWLEEHLPNPLKKELAAIEVRLQAEGLLALPALEDLVAQAPDFEEARLRLAQWKVGSAPEEALELLAPLRQKAKYYEAVQGITCLVELQQHSITESGPITEKIAQAQAALREYANEAALVALIEAVRLDKHYAEDLPRRATIAFFHFLGASHPLTRQYRRKFDMALY
ncbi:MAG: tetratricopeptide repeat protein [Microscillaceae bacterium]|nr:tetratricopeptide repeat protein [Microscillaceae bacterium]